jgi:ribosomal protein S18 acetylase RimI-like enzyme
MSGPAPREDITVRCGRPHDRAAVTGIGFAAMRGFGIKPDPLYIDRDLATFGDRAEHKIIELVAEAEGEVIGSILASAVDADTAKITGFYVSENARGAGIGKQLLLHAIEACQSRGYARIELVTHARMQAAIRLYTKFGFVQTKAETHDGHDYLHFCKALGADGTRPS